MIPLLLQHWKLIVGFVVGLVVGSVGGFKLGHVLGVKEGVRVERAAAIARTEKAINEVNDEAQRARAMLVHCRDNGRLYDFATGKCGEKRPDPGNTGDNRD